MIKRDVEVIYRTYYKPLLAYARRISRSFELAEEAVSTFFARMYLEKQVYRNVQNSQKLEGYLFKSIKNEILMLKNKRFYNPDKIFFYNDFEDAELADETSGWDTICKRESERLNHSFLYKEIEKLTEKQKEAIELRYFQEMNQRSAAQKMGVSVNTYKTHLKLALKQFKQTKQNFLK